LPTFCQPTLGCRDRQAPAKRVLRIAKTVLSGL
jgi:hypothetical protein